MSVEEAALGILTVVDTRMSLAVREVSVAKGHDARDFALVASGGAGPLHAVSIARELKIPRLVIPVYPGTFSAFGMLLADLRHDYVQTFVGPLSQVNLELLNTGFSALEREGTDTLVSEGVDVGSAILARAMDLRYQGQEYTLPVPMPSGALNAAALELIAAAFHDVHHARYAQSAPDEPVEVVNIRVSAVGRMGGAPPVAGLAISPAAAPDAADKKRDVFFAGTGAVTCPLVHRTRLTAGDSLCGPALIEEPVSTTVLHPGDRAMVHESGALMIEVAVP